MRSEKNYISCASNCSIETPANGSCAQLKLTKHFAENCSGSDSVVVPHCSWSSIMLVFAAQSSEAVVHTHSPTHEQSGEHLWRTSCDVMSSKTAALIQELIFICRPRVVFRVCADSSACRWKNAMRALVALPLPYTRTHTLAHTVSNSLHQIKGWAYSPNDSALPTSTRPCWKKENKSAARAAPALGDTKDK